MVVAEEFGFLTEEVSESLALVYQAKD